MNSVVLILFLSVSSAYSTCTSEWTSWQGWSECRAQCGAPTQYRLRSCKCENNLSCYSKEERMCESFCVRPSEYWKLHNKFATIPELQKPWPISETKQFYCGQNLYDALVSSDTTHFSLLAQQFISASLNVAIGVIPSTDIIDLLKRTETLLSKCILTFVDEADLNDFNIALASIKSFNDGIVDKSYCNDNPCCFSLNASKHDSSGSSWGKCEGQCSSIGVSRRRQICSCPVLDALKVNYDQSICETHQIPIGYQEKQCLTDPCDQEMKQENKNSQTICKWSRMFTTWSECDTSTGLKTRKKQCICVTKNSTQYFDIASGVVSDPLNCTGSLPQQFVKCSIAPNGDSDDASAVAASYAQDNRWTKFVDRHQNTRMDRPDGQTVPTRKGNNNQVSNASTDEKRPNQGEKSVGGDDDNEDDDDDDDASRCFWSDWSFWSDCSSRCGVGIKFRQQRCRCLNSSLLNDQRCSGSPQSEQIECHDYSRCNLIIPDDDNDPDHSNDDDSSATNNTQTSGECKDLSCCSFSVWTEWSVCSFNCGGGISFRKKICSCSVDDTNIYSRCDKSSPHQRIVCNAKIACPEPRSLSYWVDEISKGNKWTGFLPQTSFISCDDPSSASTSTSPSSSSKESIVIGSSLMNSKQAETLLMKEDPESEVASLWLTLAKQYITAQLNRYVKQSMADSEVQSIILQASALLQKCNQWNQTDEYRSIDLMKFLSMFNSGKLSIRTHSLKEQDNILSSFGAAVSIYDMEHLFEEDGQTDDNNDNNDDIDVGNDSDDYHGDDTSDDVNNDGSDGGGSLSSQLRTYSGRYKMGGDSMSNKTYTKEEETNLIIYLSLPVAAVILIVVTISVTRCIILSKRYFGPTVAAV
eukprot:TRINITY_DN6258_c0_g1_i1.p1 TRINITY_DN6258_c0_g1~~TRINITY_DN6258_c0_g1_i1.p1  ORF type:complete len:866 (-),score=199.27 TRINITY_DN6258_c0_g1_i1:317-2914(-)